MSGITLHSLVLVHGLITCAQQLGLIYGGTVSHELITGWINEVLVVDDLQFLMTRRSEVFSTLKAFCFERFQPLPKNVLCITQGLLQAEHSAGYQCLVWLNEPVLLLDLEARFEVALINHFLQVLVLVMFDHVKQLRGLYLEIPIECNC